MAFTPFTGGELPNLVNVTKRTDPDGSIADIGEVLAQSNPMLNDFPYVEGNLALGHQYTVRTDIPEPQLRLLNYGTRATKSATMQVTDSMCMMQDWAVVDKDVASLNGNKKEFMLSEHMPHLEGMSQKAAKLMWYGDDATDPTSMLGLAPRFDSLTMIAGIPEGKFNATINSIHLPNIIDFGGTGSNLTSVYFVVPGTDAVFMTYPKGSQAGLVQEQINGGKTVVISDNDGGEFMGYKTRYEWKLGMCVKDWRCVARLCNIDLSSLLTTESEMEALYKAMIRLMYAVPSAKRKRGIFYVGSAISAALDLAATQKKNLALSTVKDAFGEELTAFRKRPIRECDVILEAETQIT